jgi:hypothetical protein
MPDKDFETVSEMGAEARGARRSGEHVDDSLMERYERWNLDRFSAWDAVRAVWLTTLLLLVFAGSSVRDAADDLDPGLGRDVVKAVGGPTGWVSDRLPLVDVRRDATSWLSPDEELAGGGFEAGAANEPRTGADPSAAPDTPEELGRLLVTGDSLAQPLDTELAQSLADDGAGTEVLRDARLGTRISTTDPVDWGALSATQAEGDDPDATVMFIGANEGYPIEEDGEPPVSCCGPGYERALEARIGLMMDNYIADGESRLYWLTIPTQRDPARGPIADDVNNAIKAAAAERPGAVTVIDLVPVFTPGNRYRDAMDVDGEEQIVRDNDGIHLNEVGAALAAEIVLEAIDEDFER